MASDSYRLCRADAHPRAHANEEVIPPDAISLILELATLPGGHASLFSLLLTTILHHPLVLFKVRPSAPTPAVDPRFGPGVWRFTLRWVGSTG